MTTRSSMLQVRLDDKTKSEASAALEAMGLSVSDAVRLFLRRVVIDQAFPLELKVPNSTTRLAMAEADKIVRNRKARFSNADTLMDDLEKTGRK